VDVLAVATVQPRGVKKAAPKLSYVAFVVTANAIQAVDLGEADRIDDAVGRWRVAAGVSPSARGLSDGTARYTAVLGFGAAVVPHAPFLLDSLLPAEIAPKVADRTLLVGGVDYAAQLASPGEERSLVPVAVGDRLRWGALPGAKAETAGIALRAETKKLDAKT